MAESGQKVKSGRGTAFFAGGLFAVCALSACGGPTYGTGKSSGQQTVEDFANITKWGSLNGNKDVDMRPRPELVRPSAAALAQPLPPPQEPLAKSGGKDWPESPEERRARLRAEATAMSGNPNYVSPIIQDDAPKTPRYLPTGIDRAAERADNMPDARITKRQAARYKELRREQTANSSARARKYLSDPPLDYFKPSPNAPQGDLGTEEDEKQKAKSGRTSIFGK